MMCGNKLFYNITFFVKLLFKFPQIILTKELSEVVIKLMHIGIKDC
jgi:hypothetical protein